MATVECLKSESGDVLIAIDGVPVGPKLTPRAARVVKRWLEGGALEDFEGGPGTSKLARALGKVDDAVDAVGHLLKHGLK